MRIVIAAGGNCQDVLLDRRALRHRGAFSSTAKTALMSDSSHGKTGMPGGSICVSWWWRSWLSD